MDETSTEEQDLQIGSIVLHVGDLFDFDLRDENRLFHRSANALHIRTRESTVLNALPIRKGDDYNPPKLAEAERLLRSKRYLRNARVVPVRRCGDVVDILVSTTDNWTLTPSVSVGTAGGANRYSVEVQDLNILGLGKELKFKLKKVGDAKTSSFTYNDDNLLGTRHLLRMEAEDSLDGQSYRVEVGRPFYIATGERAWGLSWNSTKQGFNPFAGLALPAFLPPELERNSTLRVDSNRIEARMARRFGIRGFDYSRFGVGVRHESQHTHATILQSGTRNSYDFSETYPFFYSSWRKGSWKKAINFQSLGRVEDIDLSLNINLEVGFLLSSFSNEESAVRVQGNATKSWQSSKDSIHRVSYHHIHYLDALDRKKFDFTTGYEYFRWLSEFDQIDLKLNYEEQAGYSPIHDFHLGGEYGLKGYPNDYSQGDRRLYALAEYRHVTKWYPWKLARTAWNLFVEAGQTGLNDVSNEIMSNVGFGIAIAPSRSSSADIVRLELVYPLTQREDVDGFQIFIGSRIAY